MFLPSRMWLGLTGFAAQQVVDVQLAQVRGADHTLRQFAHGRQGAHLHVGALHLRDHLVAAVAAERGDGQQHGADLQRTHQARQVGRAVDRQAVEHVAVQAVVVVHETDHPHFMAVGHGSRQLAPGIASAIDQHAGQGDQAQLVAVQAAQPEAGQHARRADGEQQQQRLDQADGAGHAVDAEGGEHGGEQQGVDRAGLEHRHQRCHARVAEDGAVEAVDDEDRQGQHQRHADRRHRLPEAVAGQLDPFTQAQVVGQPDGQAHTARHPRRAPPRAWRGGAWPGSEGQLG